MSQAIALIIIGFVLLIKGADLLVDGSSDIAKKFHIPEIIIGLTIVSIGTSMPEFFISLTSALNEHSDISIGNVIGANICNLLLILGIASTIRRIKFQRETRIIEIPMCLFFTIVFMVLCNEGNSVSRADAMVFIGLFAIFIMYTFYMAKKGESFDLEDDDEEDDKEDKKETEKTIKERSLFKDLIFIILGIAGLKVGGNLTVDNAVFIAEYFKVSEQIISLTIISIATTFPEMVTTVTASIKGNSDIAIGNIIGSNIFNMLLIVGVSALIHPVSFNAAYNFQLSILIFSTILLLIYPLIYPFNKMSKRNGAFNLVLYVIYMILLFKV